MGMQTMGSAPARNSFRAAGGAGVKAGEISVGAAHASTVTAGKAGRAPAQAGPGVRGAGMSHGSTVAADGVGKAPVSKGGGVQGFSGNGTLKGYC